MLYIPSRHLILMRCIYLDAALMISSITYSLAGFEQPVTTCLYILLLNNQNVERKKLTAERARADAWSTQQSNGAAGRLNQINK